MVSNKYSLPVFKLYDVYSNEHKKSEKTTEKTQLQISTIKPDMKCYYLSDSDRKRWLKHLKQIKLEDCKTNFLIKSISTLSSAIFGAILGNIIPELIAGHSVTCMQFVWSFLFLLIVIFCLFQENKFSIKKFDKERLIIDQIIEDLDGISKNTKEK